MNAGSGGFDPEGDVRRALAAVVRDHGPDILADPRHLGSALNVLLPTAPEEAGILVAAARAGASAQLAEQAAMNGPSAALEAVSASLAQSGALDPPSSRWAVGEIARTMGFPISDPPPAGPVQSGMAALPVLGSIPPPPPAAPPGFAAATAAYPPPPAPPPPPPPPSGSPLFPASPPFTPVPVPSAFTPPPAPPAPSPRGAPPTFPGRGAPPSGSSSPGGTPPRPAPAGRRRRGRPPTALIVAAIVVVLIVVYVGAAATAGFFPFGAAARVAGTPTPTPVPTFTSTPTIAPSSSPTAEPSSSGSPAATGSPSLSPLAGLLPSYVTGNTADSCSPVPTSDELASGVSAEELCDLTESQDAEDYVLYVGFPTESLATTYFTSLLTGNGMKASQGSCQNLTLVTASDGSSQYCEGTYKTTGTNSNSGSYFVFTGSPSFQLGNSNAVSSLDVCSAVNRVDVLGFTDPTYSAVGLAMSCLGTEQDQEVNSDFLAGNFFLGS